MSSSILSSSSDQWLWSVASTGAHLIKTIIIATGSYCSKETWKAGITVNVQYGLQ